MTESHATSSNERWLPWEEVAFVVQLHFFSPLDIVIATHRSSSKGKFVKKQLQFLLPRAHRIKVSAIVRRTAAKKSKV